MIKIKSNSQLSLPGLEDWRNQYSDKKLKLLENSWAGVFRKYVLPELPVEKLVKYFCEDYGRPSKELRASIGVVVLQQFFNLTDEETLQEFAFNQQWHFALECFDEEDQIISPRTLWTLRNRIVTDQIGVEIFEKATNLLIKEFKVNTEKQRLDSVHVYSNMAKLGRIRLMSKTLNVFLKFIKKHFTEIFNSEVNQDLKDIFFNDANKGVFGQIKPSESEKTLQQLAEHINDLLIVFSDNDTVVKTKEFKLLERVFSEQCYLEKEKAVVKAAKEVSCDSLQNPSDPDAGYDGNKGQGFQTQIIETYTENEEDLLNLITYVHTETAANHDSYALTPALENLKQRDICPNEILCDAAYGGQKNIDDSKEKEVSVIAPVPGKKSNKGLDSFEVNQNTNELTSCPAGYYPDVIQQGKNSGTTVKWHNDKCSKCPLHESCPTKITKYYRTLRYTKNEILACLRRVYEETEEFKNKYRFRSGIEATNSRFIHQTEARRSRYRGLLKMKSSQALKALFINITRIKNSQIWKVIVIFLLFLTKLIKISSKFQLKSLLKSIILLISLTIVKLKLLLLFLRFHFLQAHQT